MTNDINRQIAEKVVGLRLGHLCDRAAGAFEVGYRECPCGEIDLRHLGLTCQFDRGYVTVPNYINDPAAVFGPGGVVDKMLSKGFNFTMRRGVDGQTQASFQGAAFAAQSSNQLVAVCRAALAAIGGSND